MNFDDILKEFEASKRPGYNEDERRAEDVRLLVDAWVKERTVPELLPYEQELIDRILIRIRKQIELIEMNSIELQTHEREIKLRLVVIESELDRVQFIIRSYTRTRLQKIDKYSLYIRSNDKETAKLSNNEFAYMERHLELLLELYNSQFMKNLPESLQAIDETGGGVSMIDEPDLDRPVFVQATAENVVEVDDEEIELTKNGIYVVRYRAVKDLVETGDVRVL
ncbi:hypothetical protein KL918_002941 [Ogataea parapolymorpha]|uniref:DNA replication complex GINS protein SLD5 n=1 Tax=Ogataea parapolymorpha (strain ATCC 26012 / BCRC 20466 / JCM 22074 / NRRL Y-7560 / DL-1) TaxID=871575 RepID=W1QCW9_OGAPD|nr:Subunit of the GINS complex (Sld5p, Psf1p, Psf2p, Psf3p) [Ogataea parapolymorpha DL-1]ESW97567.1 Subunit of the GINS complex (Sld5p, Psf1p, Psf2p, Psf3p) [Ogataea parapolymorpha DL-1]KAG7866746.1 hypothetical protein KL918_002941 [Ogataea parapolymorpha]KAG7871897.1 hypothetical protein KL916_003500 [Ogataea parapolymorpha]